MQMHKDKKLKKNMLKTPAVWYPMLERICEEISTLGDVCSRTRKTWIKFLKNLD